VSGRYLQNSGGVVKMEAAQKSGVTKALPRKGLAGAMAQVKKRYHGLRNRYGSGYIKAMLVVVFLAFSSPIPGSTLVGMAVVVVIAEVHRAVSKRGGFPEAIAGLVVVVKAHLPCWAMGRWPSPPR
jgi:hypothetical protein